MGRDVRRKVPVILNVIEIQLEDRPQVLSDPCSVPIRDQPVGVKNEGSGSQSWTIPLWSTCVYPKQKKNRGTGTCEHTPTTGKSGLVNVKFGFSQTTGEHSATRIGHLLDTLLGLEKLVDLST